MAIAVFLRHLDPAAYTYQPRPLRILFVGDMMFDRTIRKDIDEKGADYPFSCVRDFMRSFDAVIGNLEGPITATSSLSSGTKSGEANNTAFTFATDTAEILRGANVRAVSMGNNHILDFGRAGVRSTEQALRGAKIAYFGDPIDPTHKYTVIDLGDSLNVTGKKVALVGYNQFLGVDSPDATIAAIQSARGEADLVFVFSHWGNEYSSTTEDQTLLAHKFIDAGADAVLGAHPHVVQSEDIYGGKPIYYSLGNFVFDQYFSPDVMHSLGVEADIGDTSVSFKEHSFELSPDGLVCLVDRS